jgi:hypothetical protein
VIALAIATLLVRECARCHPAEAKPHPATSMAHAMEPPAETPVLQTHPVLTAKKGEYSYRIENNLYTVSDRAGSLTFPILWAFGLGDAGQTYVFEKDGVQYESRVSFFRAIDGLDWTLGATNTMLWLSLNENDNSACAGCSMRTLSRANRGASCHPPAHEETGTGGRRRNFHILRAVSSDLGRNCRSRLAWCGQCSFPAIPVD